MIPDRPARRSIRRNTPVRRGDSVWCSVAVAAAVLTASPTYAQGSGDGFLFRPPSGGVAIRGGVDHANAGSDVFSFAVDRLTLNRRDFSGLTLVTDVGFRVAPRVDALFSLSYSGANASSEFRHWLDNNDRPIEQATTFMRVPMTGSLKAYLTQPGRSIGHFAWIPQRVAPYVGAGGGVMWYRFRQEGDFIDFRTTRVFNDLFDSSGWTPTAQAFVGTDISFSPRLALSTEARYQWAKARLTTDFSGFDRIDLSGFTVTAGLSIRY